MEWPTHGHYIAFLTGFKLCPQQSPEFPFPAAGPTSYNHGLSAAYPSISTAGDRSTGSSSVASRAALSVWMVFRAS